MNAKTFAMEFVTQSNKLVPLLSRDYPTFQLEDFLKTKQFHWMLTTLVQAPYNWTLTLSLVLWRQLLQTYGSNKTKKEV
jgi:hypothetical protein